MNCCLAPVKQKPFSRAEPAKTSSAGFSLIEILVVLLVIGIAVSMAALTIAVNDPQQQVRDETEQLMEKMRFALDDAIFSGETLALYLVAGNNEQPWRYGWLRFRDNDWLPQAEILNERSLPTGLAIEVSIENQPLDLVRFSAANPQPQPMIAIYPSGEITPFEVRFYSEEHGFDEGVGRRVTLDETMQLVSYRDGEEDEES